VFGRIILAIGVCVLSGCGSTGDSWKFSVPLDAQQHASIVSDVGVESVASDENESYLNVVKVPRWGKFDSRDLRNLEQSLHLTLARNLPDHAARPDSRLNIHVFVRRYVVSWSNTGGGVLATVAWAATDAAGNLVFDEQFHAWQTEFPLMTVGLAKTRVHEQIVRRIATTALWLAAHPAVTDIPPVEVANTSTSLDEAISGLPVKLVSMGNPVLAMMPSVTLSTIGMFGPSGAKTVQWAPTKLSADFDWPGYLSTIDEH